jgi:hypothetical protein
MVISKPVRPKKKTIANYINVDTTPKRVTTKDKVIESLKKNKTGMSLIAIGEDADIASQGNLHAVMKMMLRRGEVTLAPCTHCGRTELYKLSN